MAVTAQAPSSNVSQLLAMYNQGGNPNPGGEAAQPSSPSTQASAASPGGDNVSQLMSMYTKANPGVQQSQQSQGMSPADANFLGGVPAALGSYAGSAIRGAAQGISNLGTGAINLQERLYAPLFGKPVPAPMAENLDQNDPNPISSTLGNLASSIVPGMPEVSGADEAARLVGNVAPKIGAFLGKAAPAINTAATGAGYGALYGSANGNTPTAGSIAASAALPLGLQGAIKAPAALGQLGLQYLAKAASKDTNDILTPAEAAVRSNQIGDAPVSLGALINSPGLEGGYQNLIGSAPFSGVKAQLKQTVNAFNQSGQNISKMLLGDTAPEEANSTVASEIQKTYNTNRSNVKQDYKASIQEADNPTTPMSAPFSLNASPTLDKFIAKTNSENAVPDSVSGVLSQLQDKSIFNPDVDGQISLQKAQNVKSMLGKTAARLRLNPQTQFEASTLGQAHDALDNDIQMQLHATNPTAERLYQAANQNFKQNVVPYRDKSIFPIATGKVDNPQNLSSILANNQNANIRTVANNLSPQAKNLTLYDLFDSAAKKDEQGDQIINPNIIANNYAKLPQNATKLLASPEVQQALNNHLALQNVTKNAQLSANPPFTGGRVPSFLQTSGYLAGLGYAAKAHKGLLPVIPGAILANRAAARFLESPQLRQAYINQSLPRITNPNSIAGKAVSGLGALADPRLIANAINQQ